MLVIFNNDKKNTVVMTQGSHDYVTNTFHFSNTDIKSCTPEMIEYLVSLRDTLITSIEIQRNNHDYIDDYKDLNAHVKSVEQFVRDVEGEENNVITMFTVDIINS